MILLFDENMPPRVADALTTLGTCDARHVTRHLPKGSLDEEIFDFVSTQRWLLVTQDENIRRKPHQRRALQQSGIGAFILTGRAHRTPDELMVFLLQRMSQIQALVERTSPPFIFGVPDRGRIERLDR